MLAGGLKTIKNGKEEKSKEQPQPKHLDGVRKLQVIWCHRRYLIAFGASKRGRGILRLL